MKKIVDIKQLSGISKEKLSLKIRGPYTDYENTTATTRNGVQSSVDEETLRTPLKGTAKKLQKQTKTSSENLRNIAKKAGNDEPISSGKSNLLTWEGFTKKVAQEGPNSKRGTSYYFYTPKAAPTHSAERNSMKFDKDAFYNTQKNSHLPTLKLSSQNKKNNN